MQSARAITFHAPPAPCDAAAVVGGGVAAAGAGVAGAAAAPAAAAASSSGPSRTPTAVGRSACQKTKTKKGRRLNVGHLAL